MIISPEEERTPGTHYNMDEPEDNVLSEISQSQKEKDCYDSTYRRDPESSNSERQEVEWWLPRAAERKKQGLVDRVRVSVLRDERVLEICVQHYKHTELHT